MSKNNESQHEVEKSSTSKDVELFQLFQESDNRINEHLEEIKQYKPDYSGRYMVGYNLYGNTHSSNFAPVSAIIAPSFITIGTLLGLSGFGLGWLVLPLISPFIIRKIETKYGIYGDIFGIDYTKKRKNNSLFWKMFTKFMMTKKQRQIVISMQQEKEEYDTAVELYNLLIQKTRIDLANDLEIINKYFATQGEYTEINEGGSLIYHKIPEKVVTPTKLTNRELSAEILSRLSGNS